MNKFYKSIDIRDELPETPDSIRLAKVYDTDLGPLAFEGKDESEFGWYDNTYDKYPKPRYWFKELSIIELMSDYTNWLTLNTCCYKTINGVCSYTMSKGKSDGKYDGKSYTSEELVNIYLEKKGILKQ